MFAPTSMTMQGPLPLRVGTGAAMPGRAHARQAPEHERRGGHDGARVAGRDEALRLAGLHGAHRDGDRGVLLGADGGGGALSMPTTSGASTSATCERPWLGQQRADRVSHPHEEQLVHADHPALHGKGGALDHAPGCVVASHRIDGDLHLERGPAAPGQASRVRTSRPR
jgi:hypothetical protein